MRAVAIKLFRAPELITLVLLIATLVIGASFSRSFLNLDYLLDRTSSTLLPAAFLALAMTFLIIASQIDLSVASGAVLVMVSSALLYRDAGAPMWLVILLAPLMGATLGLFNGLLVTKLRLPALVVTLGTLALYRGLAMILIGEGSISGFPRWFHDFSGYRIGGSPGLRPGSVVGGVRAVPMLIFLGVALVAGLVLRFTTFGRRVYATGTNEEAARFSAIRTDRIKLLLFVMSGVAMGAAALMQMSVNPSVSYKFLAGDELVAITAVVLGGTSINGGRGGILGTVLAVLLLAAVGAAMGINNIAGENKLAIIGTLLIGAVVVNDLIARLSRRSTR